MEYVGKRDLSELSWIVPETGRYCMPQHSILTLWEIAAHRLMLNMTFTCTVPDWSGDPEGPRWVCIFPFPSISGCCYPHPCTAGCLVLP